jgi:hypothetical protein
MLLENILENIFVANIRLVFDVASWEIKVGRKEKTRL